MKRCLVFIVVIMAMLVIMPLIATACTGCGVFGFAISATPELAKAVPDSFLSSGHDPGPLQWGKWSDYNIAIGSRFDGDGGAYNETYTSAMLKDNIYNPMSRIEADNSRGSPVLLC